jgi:hypothetical protein
MEQSLLMRKEFYTMNIVTDNLKIIPKDNAQCGIPRLSCDSIETSSIQNESILAMATVPFQQFRALNDPEAGLKAGTLFKELDLPFYGVGGVLL